MRGNEQMSKRNSVKANVIYNMLKTISSLFFPLVSFPYISRTLLTESVGKVNFGNSVVSYFSLLASLGISVYAIRECAKVRDDKEKLSQLSSQLFIINMITTMISYVALAITLLIVPAFQNYRTLIVLQSTTILCTTIGADWINTAMEDFKYITIRSVIFQVISLVLMFTFIHKPEDYIKYALISVISSSASNITNVIYRRRFCHIRLIAKLDLKKHMPPILMMFSMLFAQTIFCNTDQTILGLFWGDHEVGLYSTSVKVYNMVNSTVASIALVVMPKMSYCFATKDYIQANLYFKKAMNFIVVLGLPCAVGLCLMSNDIIALVGGPEYAKASTSLCMLSVAMACSFIGGLIGNVINIPAGREKVSLISCISAAVVNLLLNLILIPKYSVNAAALTTAIAEAVGLVISFVLRDRRIRFDNIFKTVLAPLVGVVVMCGVVFAIQYIISTLILRSVLTVLCGAFSYCIILLLMKHPFTMEIISLYIKRIKSICNRKGV